MELKRVKKDNIEYAIESAKLFFWNSDQKIINDKFFTMDTNILIVAVEADKVVGSVYGYCLERYDTDRKQLFTYLIDVLEEYRKMGIGKKLVKEFLKNLHGGKYHNAFVITNQDNVAAMTLYKSVGATRIISKEGQDVLFQWKAN